MREIIFVGIISTLLCGCSLAPTYHRPELYIPADYKETGSWQLAAPAVAELDRGNWWEIYNDSVLNDLEDRVTSANQNLQAAIARYEQARAIATVARSYLVPTINIIGVPDRQKTSLNVANPATVTPFNDVLLATDLSYEIDVWGRVRNAFFSARDSARASSADVAAIDLSLHAELASNYFSLRGTDQSQRVLDDTVKAYEKALYLNRMLYQGGAAPVEDVYLAETQLETAKTLSTDMKLRRAQLEHAIAVLIGEVPANFSLPVLKTKVEVITIIPELPSTLLERRPDIAAAELRVQAANANIGVARAAYFPQFNLITSLGVESSSISNLFQSPSLIWSLGPALGAAALGTSVAGTPISWTLIDGGRISALTDQAWAIYYETVANYRQTVLNAYQEVEDNLAALHRLGQENITQTAAAAAAYKAVAQELDRFKGGLITYLPVVVEQSIALQAELTSIDIRTRYQLASVQLIKALGGGWDNPNVALAD